MVQYYAVACLMSQPYVDEPELFLLYKLFDFVGSFYTSHDYPTLSFVSTDEGVIALAVYALIPTIKEEHPRYGFPYRSPDHPVRELRHVQRLFNDHCARYPSARARLTNVIQRTQVIGSTYHSQKPYLPSNLSYN